MHLSQTQLTAYLDDELTENERLQIEHQLAQSSESQARLDQLRREIAQMAHALDCLGPEQPPSAWLAWKRLRSHLPTASQPAPSDTPDSPASTSAVWESPSLLTTVRERIKQPWSTRPPLRQTRWQRKLFVGAVSTLLVLAIFIVGALLLGSPRTPLSAPEPQLPPEAVPVAATFSNTTPPGSITRPISTTQAIVALQPISQGAPFSAGAIGHREWPANNLPPNAIADEVEAIGQVAQTDIVQGQVIVRDMLAAATSATGVPNGDFGYGIQVDPQGNTTANIKHLKTLRMNWVKFQMPWREVEPDSGRYQWTDWDTLIEAYAAAGLNILLTIADAPHWSRPPEDSIDVDGFPQDAADYAQFVAQVADRYQGRVQAIEVWEEQNIYYSVGGQGRVDPAAYTDLLKQAYTAIKAVNPDMIVVSGGLAPTSAPPPMALDDVAYLRQLYANGAQPYLDAVGAHPLSFANPPDAFYQGGDFDPTRGYDDHRSFFFRNTMEAYRQVMVENGDEAKAIWPTDFGWAVRRTEDPRFEFAQENTPAEQAEYTLNAFEMGQTWGWVGPMFLGNLDYNLTAPDTGRANFGILNTPTYDALVTRGLGHQAVADLSPVAAGSDVVIVLDISGSMAAEDFAPNRLEATKTVIHNFVDTYQ
ncbi:MAG TPA: cellulase family glycosylhydrolase, partial [Anaerolineae bacterium]|nr:cellulase family glycosylhydrolase [Anaerolineae bacterium]